MAKNKGIVLARSRSPSRIIIKLLTWMSVLFTIMTIVMLYHMSIISADSIGAELEGFLPKLHADEDQQPQDMDKRQVLEVDVVIGDKGVQNTQRIKQQFDRLIVEPCGDPNGPGL